MPDTSRARFQPIADLLCRALGANAASVAIVDGEELLYIAAAGAGAEELVGMRLPPGRGLAGYVVAACDAIEVTNVASDPRFARDVAEATTYVPTAILAVPVVTPEGEVVGVLSVLDRARGDGEEPNAMEVAGQFAELAASMLAPRASSADEGAPGRGQSTGDPLGERERALVDAIGDALTAYLTSRGDAT